ncbi:hypothetical protein JOB18_024622 [Solea senegalensis]|uniref:Uncharacterized protein n=1 Tax=Solea senegalensis TaxID=28829 RepID=A0AAV6T779_SOLSE|nr:hypothetical protein JOB18_024622 [Solea senegalensis]
MSTSAEKEDRSESRSMRKENPFTGCPQCPVFAVMSSGVALEQLFFSSFFFAPSYISMDEGTQMTGQHHVYQ